MLVNVSTFETIVTGFERINRERTRVVDKKIVEYHGIKTKIEQLRENVEVKAFDVDINKLRDQRTKINSQISEITVNGQKRIQDIIDSGSNKAAIDQLQKQIDTINSNIDLIFPLGISVKIDEVFDTTATGTIYRKDNPFEVIQIGDILTFK